MVPASNTSEAQMPQGSKAKYTPKQKRKAVRRAWATVSAQDGGGRKGGSGSEKDRE